MAEKASLQDLGLTKEKLEGASFDDIPENLGQSFADPPQPGKYRFKLPVISLAKGMWAKVDTDNFGTRLACLFEDADELKIVQSPGGAANGETFRTRLSNVPRERGKEKILTSDMDLFLRALGITKKPDNNPAYATALVSCSEKEFTADLEYSYSCNPTKPIYVDDGQGGQQKVDDKVGCGARYYMRDVAKVPVNPQDPNSARVQPLRIQCSNKECGALIRAYANLSGFKA
jgi:hypothetical protein